MRQVWSDSANFGTGGYILEDTPLAEDRIYDQRNVPSLGQALQGLISDTKQNAEGLLDKNIWDYPGVGEGTPMTGLLNNNYSQRNPPSLGEAMSGLLGNWGSNIEMLERNGVPIKGLLE